MTTGMIWFDNDLQTNIEEKIKLAIRYYHRKFGSQSTVCALNPKLQEILQQPVADIEVNYNSDLSTDYIWLGNITIC